METIIFLNYALWSAEQVVAVEQVFVAPDVVAEQGVVVLFAAERAVAGVGPAPFVV